MRDFLRLMRYVRPYWRRLLAALVCMAVFAALSGVSLGMILPFVNVLFEEQALLTGGAGNVAVVTPAEIPADPEGEPASSLIGTVASDIESGDIGLGDIKGELRVRLLAVFASDTPQSALLKICIGLILVFLVRAIIFYLQALLMITLEQRVIRDLRNAIFSHLTSLSLSFFQREQTGQLISRVTNDVMLVRGALVATFAQMFREVLLAMIYLGVAVWISWRLSIITVLVLPPMMLLIGRLGIRLRRRNVRIQEKMADITSTIEESISGIRVVQAFSMEEYERKRFFSHTAGYLRRFVRMEALGALAGPLTEFLGVVGVVAILWYGGRQVLLTETISSDWFLMFLAASLSTMQPLRNISRANTALQTGLAATGRVFEILDTEPAIKSVHGAPPPSDAPGGHPRVRRSTSATGQDSRRAWLPLPVSTRAHPTTSQPRRGDRVQGGRHCHQACARSPRPGPPTARRWSTPRLAAQPDHRLHPAPIDGRVTRQPDRAEVWP